MTTTANVDASAQTSPWIPSDDTFGARLALVRQKMGWGNVAEAAQACDLPVPSWRNWERDGRRPRDITEIAQKIADRTGCDYLWLVHGQRGRILVTAGSQPTTPNASSGRLPVRRTRRRTPPIPCPIGGPRKDQAAPASTVSPTQRRPMLISGPGQRISA